MSSSNTPTGLTQADLLIFDDLLSRPSAAPNRSGPPAQQSAPGPDWFSILTNGNQLGSTPQSSSQDHGDTNSIVSISPNPVNPPPAATTVRFSNYDLPKNLFTVPVQESIPPPQLTSASATSGTSGNGQDDEDFGEFTGTQPDTAMTLVANSSLKPLQPVSSSSVPVVPKPVVSTSVTSKSPSTVSQASNRPIRASDSSPRQPASRRQEGSAPIRSPPRGSLPQHRQETVPPGAAGYGGVYAQQLRFGQHLTHGPNGMAHLSESVLNGHPGVSGQQQSRSRQIPPNGNSHPPSPQKPTTAISRALLDTSGEFASWHDEAGTTISRQAIVSSPPPTAAVPKPEFLLPLFESNLFPLPLPLFQELAPLPFPLKRRVLSHPKTRKFFGGLLAGVQVAVRICAGRKRRGGRFEADREARQIAREWKILRERIAGVGMRELPVIDASFIFREYAGDISDLCLVCGVARHEKVRGCTTESLWDMENGGHAACIKWWAHEKALLDS
ncbi:hypothetical protein V1525DRAFT_404210 [Lipomyces kononenkoae]|uniref:Uncharacterized protein n=1 Tax=Lipomyces kononenkoae TaxID=34357 RepID=A0ACC3T0H0_LIPKO